MDSSAQRLIIAEIPRLRRYARFTVRDRELADDLVQECLMRAIAKIDTWEPGSNMRAWLFTILRHVAMNHWRQAKYAPESAELPPDDPRYGVSGGQESRLHVAEVQQALDRMSEGHRHILFLIAVDGLLYKDAAAILNVPLGTIRSRLSRARMALEEILNGGRKVGATKKLDSESQRARVFTPSIATRAASKRLGPHPSQLRLV